MAFSSTIIEPRAGPARRRAGPLAILAAAVLAALAALAAPAWAAERPPFTFVHVERADDPYYAPHRAYTGLELRDRHRPYPGARVAVDTAGVLGRVAGMSFELERLTLDAEADAAAAVSRRAEAAAKGDGTAVFLLDLPLDDLLSVRDALAGREVFLFNVRHDDVRLREAGCAANLFHTMPSMAMKTDALAQFLFDRDWRRVLILKGQGETDARMVAAFQASARKFGLNVVDTRDFVLSNDPRQRDRSNVALLTGRARYDVVVLADAHGEFGRYVPYRTYLPRPVVGTEGLRPSAWHWAWERHGAPQLNQRFDRVAGRRMGDADWAAWAAVRAMVEAAVRQRTGDYGRLRAYLSDEDYTLDVYKGAPANFRSWNNQLRQNVLLHTHNAVVARAPIEGFLHQRNTLDSLGRDAPESACSFETDR